jgi:TRAP-type mannitol/chloroaromatic compound transport system substrate-binding protein
MRIFFSGIIIGVAIGAMIAANAPREYKQPSRGGLNNAENQASTIINLDLASTFNSSAPFNSNLGPILIERIKKISNGNILMKFHEPETLIPTVKLFDAVSSGAVDIALSSSQLWSHKSPAFELFSSVPFGPDIISYLTWFKEHGGQDFYEKLYSTYNIHSMICGIIGTAGAGWFNHSINTVDDFKKHKIAASGLVSLVYNELGAATSKISPYNIISSLQQEKINAVAYVNPTTEHYLGLSKHVKYYYFPGWFQQSRLIDLMINLKKWNSLNKSQKEIIETACVANTTYSITASEAQQFEILKKIVIQGIDVRRFSNDITIAIKKAWLSVESSQSRSNEDFRKIILSLRKFRKEHSIWQEIGKI